MDKLKALLIGFLFCFSSLANASDSTLQFKLVDSIKGQFNNFAVDNLGFVYVVTATNQIKKLDKNLDSVAVFNNVRQNGTVSCIDVTNPLKILVYYKDFATVVLLDRFLNTRQTINLRNKNILQVKAIALSYDNNIWLFDELDACIKKIDEQGKVIFKSADFRMLFDDYENPTQIIDKDGFLYLYNAKTGWLIFDYYGALKSKIAILNWQDVDVVDGLLVGRDEQFLFRADPKLLSIKQAHTNISLKNCKKVYNERGNYFVLMQNSLELYKMLEH